MAITNDFGVSHPIDPGMILIPRDGYINFASSIFRVQ